MIKLDPEEELDDDDQPINKTPQKQNMNPPNTSHAMSNDVNMMNHQHMNNVQINMSQVNLPTGLDTQQNYNVSFDHLRTLKRAHSLFFNRKKQST